MNKLALIAVALGLAGCTALAPKPPDVHYGHQECSRCRMLVDQEPFAAARVLADGTVEVFDDTGELFEHRREQGAAADPERLWVHDFHTRAWLDGRQAHYVHADSLRSPMGYNLVAFATKEQAVSFAAQSRGRALRFDQVEKGK